MSTECRNSVNAKPSQKALNLVCVIYTGRPREGFTVGCVFIELQQTVSRKWKYKLYFILAKKKKKNKITVSQMHNWKWN